MKNLASRRFLPLSAPEFSIYQTYERQRRQRLLRIMLPVSAILFGMASAVFTVRLLPITNSIQAISWFLYGATLLLTLSSILGSLAMRRGRTTLAAMIMMIVGSLGILFILLVQAFLGEGLDALTLSEFLVFGCVIVLVGVLGNLWTVIGATLLVSTLTLLTLFLAPRPAELVPAITGQLFSITIAALILEWLIAGFLIANWLTYRQTLRTLGAAYERIEQAERLDELKDQFITHVNHELRTPIMALHGYVEYLREAQSQLSEAELAIALEKASRTGTALVALLSSILEVRRIDGKTDTYVPTMVPIRDALDTALTLIDPRETTRGAQDIVVSLPQGIAIWGEPLRLQQILTNLISNALKYSPPGTQVEVTARVVSQTTPGPRRRQRRSRPALMAEIQVRDYGLGIPPDQVSLLFKRFVRLPRDLASSVIGSGLGLYLCKVMTESMGGTIWVESSGVEGEGSTFFVRLPLPPSPYRQQENMIAVDQSASR